MSDIADHENLVRRHALETFGGREKAERWLVRPNRLFEGRTPLEVARTGDGADRVIDLLTRIDHGLAS